MYVYFYTLYNAVNYLSLDRCIGIMLHIFHYQRKHCCKTKTLICVCDIVRRKKQT